jgi:hypothetical protein
MFFQEILIALNPLQQIQLPIFDLADLLLLERLHEQRQEADRNQSSILGLNQLQ